MKNKKYLLDTNIWIHFIKGQFGLNEKVEEVGLHNCYVSIITIGELHFGAANSQRVEENTERINNLFKDVQVVPLDKVMAVYGTQKAHLKKIGRLVGNFDILIGSTAIAHNMTLVTRNVKDFENLQGIEIENWVDDAN